MLQKLGKYKILKKLGEGGMGEVYQAEDPQLHRIVAIKVISKRNHDQEAAESRFLNEARAASAFNHPNIVTIYELNESDQMTYIVMEYVDGYSLRELMRKGSVDSHKMLEIADQVCSALQEAHEHAVIHRDIKPENILLTRSGKVKVVDFGLAKRISFPELDSEITTGEHLTPSGTLVGTPFYMSPEQLKGLDLDHRADIFSLGIVLHEMFTGKLPFTGNNILEIAASILRDAADLIPANDDFAISLAEVLKRALEKDRKNRYSSVHDFREALAELRDKLPSRSRETLRPVLISRPAENLRTILVLPLEPIGRSEEETFLGIGLAHSIITDLAKIPGLTVLSKAAQTESDISKIGALAMARELGAGILLEGEVIRSGDKVGINARLTEVRSGKVLWGSTYRGAASDLFGIQDSVCHSVAEAMQLKLSSDASRNISSSGTDNLSAFELLSKGKALMERRDIRENISAAIVAFKDALAIDPRFALAHAELGQACWLQYQETHDTDWVDRAISACDHALILDPSQPQVHISLGVIYFGTGKMERAVEELKRALELQPSSDEAYKWLGRCNLRLGNVDSAVFNFRKAIEIRPGYWDHYIQLGACFLQLARYEEAAECFRKVIDLAPENHMGYDDLGCTYYFMGRFKDAADILKRAVEIHPNQVSYSNLGGSYFYLADYEEAANAFEAAAKLDPKNDVIRRNLGDALLQSGAVEKAYEEYGAAQELLKEAVRVNPKDATLMERLAVVQAKLGLRDESVRNIEKAIAIEPANTRILYARAVVYALSGEVESAVAGLQKALESGYSKADAERDPDLQQLRDYIRIHHDGTKASD
ncbi:MAG: hypothetical protein C5B54_07310 [Acidobacteria bacterium]|nr:MAG: hypothetical protein C5B54_07310 [Acidobacteriota bacterium]